MECVAVFKHACGDTQLTAGDAILQLKIKVVLRINLKDICIEVIAYRNE
jgi:hypothetical protein